MLLRKTLVWLFLIFAGLSSRAQDIASARKIVDTLTSAAFWGRGYTKGGMLKASRFLAGEFKKKGLSALNGTYFQEFSYPVNTFPDKMEVSLNDRKMVPGKDFIVAPESAGGRGKYILSKRDSTTYVDTLGKVVLLLKDKLTWSVTDERAGYVVIIADRTRFREVPKKIEFNVSSKLLNFTAYNVCASVRGTRKPDSVIVISAHYDHLGGMGKETFFPGANDNASGISMLLGLAGYYAANPPPYSIVFICFAGEEAGLIGSKYFTTHPLLPLGNIRFMINVDMVGTGDEGITVVNATQYSKEFSILTQLNAAENLLVKINPRGRAANSDHYWFTEKGVPAFFMYTMGGIKAYHDVFDVSNTLPLNEYEDLSKLIIKFNKVLMN